MLAAVTGFAWFAMPPYSEEATVPTDAIVVLTGGSLRLQSGLDLLRAGRGRQLFVSGVNHQVDLEELLHAAGNAPGWAACCVALGYDADNTAGNARETAAWMQRNNYRSLRLVTAWYHMRRGLLEFERAMPGITILPHPVFPESVPAHGWWTRPGTVLLLMSEYAKYLGALIRPSLFGGGMGPEATRFEAEMQR